MASRQYIDYEALAKEAMRGVIRAVLEKVMRGGGLVGDHHFYIAFDTQAPGVVISRRLKEKYPVEMTIVMQHRFWDLAVSEDRFEVKLTFDGIPELLGVPYKAVKVFYDPSVPYGLQFEESAGVEGQADARRGGRPGIDAADGVDEPTVPADDQGERVGTRHSLQERRDRLLRRQQRGDQSEAAPADVERRKPTIVARPSAPAPVPPVAATPVQPTPRPAVTEVKLKEAEADVSDVTAPESPPADPGASKVVDFTKFRKK